jgi:hypothetical protein
MSCLRKLFLCSCRPQYVSIESDKVSFSDLIEEFNTLHWLGYKKFFIQQQANIHQRSVPSNSIEGQYVDYRFPADASGPFGSDLGPDWLSMEDAIKRYQSIFKEYKYFGDHSLLRRLPFGEYVLSVLAKRLGRPVPGWYDTHASL